MKWPYGKYKLWVINTGTAANLYLWDQWKDFIPSFDVLINLTTEKAFIRSYQAYEQNNGWLGFGRMKWNEENNIKWTTKYRGSSLADKTLTFFNTQIWAPDWNKVCHEEIQPDIFINLYHNPENEITREGLIIALPNRLYKKNKALVEGELLKIARNIPNSIMSSITRYWRPFWIGNCIEDIGPDEILAIIEPKK